MALYKSDGSVLTDLKPLRLRKVTGNIQKTLGKSASLSAPNVDGYQFMFWTSVYTTSWVASIYPQDPQSQQTNFWVAAVNGAQSTSTGGFGAIAVYTPSNFD